MIVIRCDNSMCNNHSSGKCTAKELDLYKRWEGSEKDWKLGCRTFTDNKKAEAPYYYRKYPNAS